MELRSLCFKVLITPMGRIRKVVVLRREAKWGQVGGKN
jgi:hypothetical protein